MFLQQLKSEDHFICPVCCKGISVIFSSNFFLQITFLFSSAIDNSFFNETLLSSIMVKRLSFPFHFCFHFIP